jgi:hypothetical protein
MPEGLRPGTPTPHNVSMPETYSQDVVAEGLPPAQALIDIARTAAMKAAPAIPDDPDKAAEARETRLQAAASALNQWAPAVDQMTDIAGAAAFLGRKSDHSIRRKRFRPRADGTMEWPEPDATFGRSPAWKYRTIVAHLAAAPGRGHPGATLGRTNEHKPWTYPRKTS